jgi:hypothetical protein
MLITFFSLLKKPGMAILALFFKYQKVIRSYEHMPDTINLVA